jgi:mannan endo-1,4-beta-mannosidase
MTVIQKWNGKTTNLTVDVNTLMSECQSLGIGYLGWQWAGDYFSIAFNNNFEAVNSYSPWGEALVNSPVYGIKASSKLATIF